MKQEVITAKPKDVTRDVVEHGPFCSPINRRDQLSPAAWEGRLS